jgi:DNA-binding response OmpR family regulator
LKNILVIEDDTDILELVTYVLNDSGYNVTSSLTLLPVQEVLEIDPNLILLDHYLPDGFGSDLCLEIKNDERLKHKPVIIFSANTGLNNIALKSRADAFIPKPFDIDNLLNKVKELLS